MQTEPTKNQDESTFAIYVLASSGIERNRVESSCKCTFTIFLWSQHESASPARYCLYKEQCVVTTGFRYYATLLRGTYSNEMCPQKCQPTFPLPILLVGAFEHKLCSILSFYVFHIECLAFSSFRTIHCAIRCSTHHVLFNHQNRFNKNFSDIWNCALRFAILK